MLNSQNFNYLSFILNFYLRTVKQKIIKENDKYKNSSKDSYIIRISSPQVSFIFIMFEWPDRNLKKNKFIIYLTLMDDFKKVYPGL